MGLFGGGNSRTENTENFFEENDVLNDNRRAEDGALIGGNVTSDIGGAMNRVNITSTDNGAVAMALDTLNQGFEDNALLTATVNHDSLAFAENGLMMIKDAGRDSLDFASDTLDEGFNLAGNTLDEGFNLANDVNKRLESSYKSSLDEISRANADALASANYANSEALRNIQRSNNEAFSSINAFGNQAFSSIDRAFGDLTNQTDKTLEAILINDRNNDDNLQSVLSTADAKVNKALEFAGEASRSEASLALSGMGENLVKLGYALATLGGVYFISKRFA